MNSRQESGRRKALSKTDKVEVKKLFAVVLPTTSPNLEFVRFAVGRSKSQPRSRWVRLDSVISQVPRRDLYTSNQTLDSMRIGTGSQSSASLFSWRDRISYDCTAAWLQHRGHTAGNQGAPTSRVLQRSTCYVAFTKAATTALAVSKGRDLMQPLWRRIWNLKSLHWYTGTSKPLS